MSESQPPAPKLKPVKVIFNEANDIPIYHADGGWALAAGEDRNLVLKFYLEYGPTPDVVTFPLLPDGNVSSKPDSVSGPDPKFFTMIREFQAGVVLSLAGARQVAGLLNQFIEAHENQAPAKNK